MLFRTFFILFFCLGATARANDLPRLEVWTAEHPHWKEDKAELAYVASRCATMFESMGNYLSDPTLEEQRRCARCAQVRANAYLSQSDIYARIGYFLSIKNGVSELEAIERQVMFSRDFSSRMQSNLQILNNLMVPPLSRDLEICTVNFSFAEAKVRQLESSYASARKSGTALAGPADQSFDTEALRLIWAFIKSRTGALPEAPMPRFTIDSGLPTSARMVFEYPSEDQPGNALQINVSPRTLQGWNRSMVNWALGHELVHYAFLMRENQWQPQTVYRISIKHHCNPEFLKLTGDIADLISDEFAPSHERLRMYSEVFRSCTRHPDQ